MAKPRTPPGPGSYKEAVEWHRQRVPMTDEEFAHIEQAAHERAFKIAGVAQADIVREVWEAIDDAIAEGSTLEEFQKAIRHSLAAAWGEERPWRVENIFRTNVQHAYSRGRWEQQTDPAVRDLRPFWWFLAILDTRTTPTCRSSNDTILPADHPWWRTHNPPLHFQCRSTIATLTEEQARARGVTAAPSSEAVPEGFGAQPGAEDWHVDWAKYPAEMQDEARRKIGAAPEPPPRRVVKYEGSLGE